MYLVLWFLFPKINCYGVFKIILGQQTVLVDFLKIYSYPYGTKLLLKICKIVMVAPPLSQFCFLVHAANVLPLPLCHITEILWPLTLYRYNKLGLDLTTQSGDTLEQVEHSWHLAPSRSWPLPDLSIKYVAIGTSHAAVVDGKGIVVFFGKLLWLLPHCTNALYR